MAVQLTDEERKARRRQFYHSFIEYLSKKIAADLRRNLAYEEEEEIRKVRENFRRKLSLVDGEANAIARRRFSSLKTDEQWHDAMKKWDEDRARERKERDESIKLSIKIEKEMSEMLASGTPYNEAVDKIKKKYSFPFLSGTEETTGGE